MSCAHLLEWFLSGVSSDVKVKHGLPRCCVSTELADKWLHLIVHSLQTSVAFQILKGYPNN